jgi:uncharacterized protein involved in tellurium resistance
LRSESTVQALPAEPSEARSAVIADPAAAPPRPDLTYLRRRARTKPAPESAVSEFVAGRLPHPPHQPHHTAQAAPPAPSAPPSAPAAPAAAPSSSLDLSAGALDLSDPPVVAQREATSRKPAPPRALVHEDVRIRAGEQKLLSVKDPTVTLTRVQSGIGQLAIEAVCSPDVGDLRLGAAYQLRGGATSTVQYAGGNRFAPSSRRPVVVAGRDEYEHLRIDLRQARELERLTVYAFSESRAELTWGGTLVVTTFGGARVEIPLELLHPGRVGVLISIYNLDGELVIRAEMETITGDVREAARAYGYDRITWRDDRSPVD